VACSDIRQPISGGMTTGSAVIAGSSGDDFTVQFSNCWGYRCGICTDMSMDYSIDHLLQYTFKVTTG